MEETATEENRVAALSDALGDDDPDEEELGLLLGVPKGMSTRSSDEEKNNATIPRRYRALLLAIALVILLALVILPASAISRDSNRVQSPSPAFTDDNYTSSSAASLESVAPDEAEDVLKKLGQELNETEPTEEENKDLSEDLKEEEEMMDQPDDEEPEEGLLDDTGTEGLKEGGVDKENGPSFDNTIAEDLQIPHVVYKDRSYRRICAPVGIGSVLCMTVKFPFEVPEQDPNYNFVHPIEPKFYGLDRANGLVFIDKQSLQDCEIQTMDMDDFNEAVKFCIEQTVAANPGKVIAVWTRKRYDGTTSFHSTGLTDDIKNVYDFFGDDHMILVLGASPSPGVTSKTRSIFGPNCQQTAVNKQGNWNCDRPGARRNLGTRPYSTIEEGHVNFGQYGYALESRRGRHWMPPQNLTERLRGEHIRTDEARQKSPLRKLSLVVEYPIAHAQSEDYIRHKQDYMGKLVYNFTKSYTDYLNTEWGKREMADLGFEIANIFAFDGLPQYNPTETGGYKHDIKGGGEQAFLQAGGYDGWRPELGSSCVGPLPPNSQLKGVQEMIRQTWIDQNYDIRWYGRIWEFSNMFWWQVKMWDGKGGSLDCTHSSSGSQGTYSTHKFFLQAMINDYFETKLIAAND